VSFCDGVGEVMLLVEVLVEGVSLLLDLSIVGVDAGVESVSVVTLGSKLSVVTVGV